MVVRTYAVGLSSMMELPDALVLVDEVNELKELVLPSKVCQGKTDPSVLFVILRVCP